MFISQLAYSALAIFIFMNVFFILSIILKNASIVDIGWGLGFVMVAIITYVRSEQRFIQSTVLFLVVLWGVRLAIHIFMRNKGKKEDWRYKKWRDDWGDNYLLRAYFQIFMLQGFFMLIISTSFIFINSRENLARLNSLNFLGVAGSLVWLTGFLFETISDYQLKVFKEDPTNKGKIITSGLWKYSRHPNYFGEVLQWWGVFIIALKFDLGFLTVISPVLITYLILFVSGVPLLEKKYAGREDFEEYKKKTSIFVPWFPSDKS